MDFAFSELSICVNLYFFKHSLLKYLCKTITQIRDTAGCEFLSQNRVWLPHWESGVTFSVRAGCDIFSQNRAWCPQASVWTGLEYGVTSSVRPMFCPQTGLEHGVMFSHTGCDYFSYNDSFIRTIIWGASQRLGLKICNSLFVWFKFW